MSDTEAYRAAVRLLAASDKTPAQLCARLTEKGFTKKDAADAVARLESEGYLNERRYAEKTVGRLYNAYYGREYVLAYLKGKQFSKDALEYADEYMQTLDFDAAAKEYAKKLLSLGKSKEQIRAAMYRRGLLEN